MMLVNPDRTFLLHHTDEHRVGLCASDDPRPPGDNAIIARLTFAQTIELADDIDETLQDCARRDGWESED